MKIKSELKISIILTCIFRYSLEGLDAAKFSIDEKGHVYSSWSFDRNTVIQL